MGAPEAFTQTTDVGHWIAGVHVRGTGDRAQPVWNPTTGEAARQVLLATAEDVAVAVRRPRPRNRPGATCRRSAAPAC